MRTNEEMVRRWRGKWLELGMDKFAVLRSDLKEQKVKALLDQEGRDDLALRVAVQPGGCSGLRYQLFFDERSLDGDVEKDFDGVKVVTDRMSAPYLGGATIARDHRGDPDARPSFETVPADRQREALGFIAEAGFGENAYRFRPELLSRLGPERWMHWGVSPASGGRPDFPLHDWALAQQGSLLGQLLDPAVLVTSDGGGVVSAARRPVQGADRAARYLLGVIARYVDQRAEVDLLVANGLPAIGVRQDGVLTSLVLLTVGEDRVERVDIVRAPAKLAAADRR